MHKLYEYIDNELKDLERKVGTGQKLSAGEIQYGDMLAHFKKSLLTNDAMEEYEDDYSREYRPMRGSSYARGARRDSMGRYSRDTDDMVDELTELMHKATDEGTKREFRKFIAKVQEM